MDNISTYYIWLFFVGVSCFTAALLPHLLRSKPISFPIVYVAFGIVIFSLPIGLDDPHPMRYLLFTERLTELLVIISLMGAGLKLGRPVGWKRWQSTWRLLGITMPLSIAALAMLSWWLLGLSAAACILLGAVLAPTDPVLASEVQVAAPPANDKNEVRFALTSEAGLNDGLAFPFTNLALALAAATAGSNSWLIDWLWYDLIYKVIVGILSGLIIGYALAYLIFGVRVLRVVSESGEGLVAIAVTLISYSVTEMIHGYGFLGVFVAALSLRNYERRHKYHQDLHQMSEDMERLFMAPMLVLFGGTLLSGILEALNFQVFLISMAYIFLVRPLTAFIGLSNLERRRRTAVAFFGIRGAGSFYYLSYAANRGQFEALDVLWATTSLVVLISIIVHGFTATPAMNRLGPE